MLNLIGVEMSSDRLIGYIKSSQLIENFGTDWLPEYQRPRVESRSKIKALKGIFSTNANIDSIKLNLSEGDWVHDGKGMILTGQIHVIDGQQRLLALRESGIQDYNVPAEVYVGLSYTEELKLFHQFNEKATKLSLSDLLRSYQSKWADLLRRVLKVKTLPMRVTLGMKQSGMSAIQYCTLLYWVENKMLNGSSRLRTPSSGVLKRLMKEGNPTDRDLQNVEVSIRRLLQSYVTTFGSFDRDATAYKRPVLLSWCHVIIDNFMQPDGTLDFGPWERKVSEGRKILNSAFIVEQSRDTTPYGHYKLYNYLVSKYFNRSARSRLPLIDFGDYLAEEDEVETASSSYGEEAPIPMAASGSF